MNKVTFQNALKDHGINSARINFSDLSNPGWQGDSMSIIDDVIRRANIEVDSIYVDTIRDHVFSSRRPKNLLRYKAKSARILLKKDGRKIVTSAPWEHAISLSYLNSKDIWIRDRTKDYVG